MNNFLSQKYLMQMIDQFEIFATAPILYIFPYSICHNLSTNSISFLVHAPNF